MLALTAKGGGAMLPVELAGAARLRAAEVTITLADYEERLPARLAEELRIIGEARARVLADKGDAAGESVDPTGRGLRGGYAPQGAAKG